MEKVNELKLDIPDTFKKLIELHCCRADILEELYYQNKITKSERSFAQRFYAPPPNGSDGPPTLQFPSEAYKYASGLITKQQFFDEIDLREKGFHYKPDNLPLELLQIFTVPRSKSESIWRSDKYIYASDALILLQIDKDYCNVNPEDFPINDGKMGPKITGLLEYQYTLPFNLNRELFEKCKTEDEKVLVRPSVECEDCGAEGIIEAQFTAKNNKTHYVKAECPICNGSGESLSAKYENTGRKIFSNEWAFSVVLNKDEQISLKIDFDPNVFDKLLQVMDFYKTTEAVITYHIPWLKPHIETAFLVFEIAKKAKVLIAPKPRDPSYTFPPNNYLEIHNNGHATATTSEL